MTDEKDSLESFLDIVTPWVHAGLKHSGAKRTTLTVGSKGDYASLELVPHRDLTAENVVEIIVIEGEDKKS